MVQAVRRGVIHRNFERESLARGAREHLSDAPVRVRTARFVRENKVGRHSNCCDESVGFPTGRKLSIAGAADGHEPPVADNRTNDCSSARLCENRVNQRSLLSSMRRAFDGVGDEEIC